MSAHNEYLPDSNEQSHTNGNGHGNGHGKIFTLKPATDPDTLRVLDARRNCLAEPKHILNRSAKAFFCEVLDRALNPNFFDCKGVVTIADTFLAQIFSVTERSVYNWKKAVAKAGYFWLGETYKTNMWPITKYSISCLHRPMQEKRTDKDGTYGTAGSKFKGKPSGAATGARHPGQPNLPLPGSRGPAPDTKSEEMPAIAGESGKILRVSPETVCGSEPKTVAGESRSGFRVGAETVFGSEPKTVAGESRNPLRVGAEADFRQRRDSEPINRGTGDKTVNRLGNRAKAAAEEKTEAPKLTARQRESENDFLAHCLDVLGRKELEENGAGWRFYFRKDKQRAWACLNETRVMQKEQRIKTTAAKTMMDLWKNERVGVGA